MVTITHHGELFLSMQAEPLKDAFKKIIRYGYANTFANDASDPNAWIIIRPGGVLEPYTSDEIIALGDRLEGLRAFL